MSSTQALHTMAADVVGHYGQAAKHLARAYRAGAERVVAAIGGRYEQLIQRESLVLSDELKASLISAEQRIGRFAVNSVESAMSRTSEAADRVTAGALEATRAFGARTAWANDMFVVNALRKAQLPAARLSLRVASGVEDVSRRLSERASGGTVEKATAAAAKAGAKAATAVKKRAVRAKRAVA